ncbi:oxidoreductase [Devosia sp.]|uniref:oxidoreductase n=1 Tax=Devosia sp. TaxID=1871048 RepID=UPI003A92A8DB
MDSFFDRLKVTALAGLALGATLGAASAAELMAPTGDVILTIEGAISVTNEGDTAVFDLAALEALPSTTYETETPWTTGVTSFEGVELSTLLELVGAEGSEIDAVAINDYSTILPLTDEIGASPLVAYKVDGAYVSVREKGPLWLVYPFDSDSRLQSEVYYSRSIWQLRTLNIRP